MDRLTRGLRFLSWQWRCLYAGTWPAWWCPPRGFLHLHSSFIHVHGIRRRIYFVSSRVSSFDGSDHVWMFSVPGKKSTVMKQQYSYNALYSDYKDTWLDVWLFIHPIFISLHTSKYISSYAIILPKTVLSKMRLSPNILTQWSRQPLEFEDSC